MAKHCRKKSCESDVPALHRTLQKKLHWMSLCLKQNIAEKKLPCLSPNTAEKLPCLSPNTAEKESRHALDESLQKKSCLRGYSASELITQKKKTVLEGALP